MKKYADQISKAANTPPAPEKTVEAPQRRNLLSTGSTLLNLAITNNPFGGFLKGHFYYLVGDSASGKTFLAMSCMAEATVNNKFKDYRFIYDNIEDGLLMNLDDLFNEIVADKMEPPARDAEDKPVFSTTVEELYFHLDDAIKQKVPFIYIVDSMDGLDSEADEKKFDQQKKAWKKKHEPKEDSRYGEDEKKVAGSYCTAKARQNSQGLRKVMNGLRETGSILIIISQTRDNIGFGWEKKTRAGGRALRFYATAEIWSSITKEITKNVNGIDRSIGVQVLLEIKKNRITGKRHEVTVPIFPSHGIDETGSLVDYLLTEGWWKKTKDSIIAKEFKLTGTKSSIIKAVESKGLLNELRSIVGQCWKEVDAACAIHRQPRYQGVQNVPGS